MSIGRLTTRRFRANDCRLGKKEESHGTRALSSRTALRETKVNNLILAIIFDELLKSSQRLADMGASREQINDALDRVLSAFEAARKKEALSAPDTAGSGRAELEFVELDAGPPEISREVSSDWQKGDILIRRLHQNVE